MQEFINHILYYETQEYNNFILVYKFWFSELLYSLNLVLESRITIVHKRFGERKLWTFSSAFGFRTIKWIFPNAKLNVLFNRCNSLQLLWIQILFMQEFKNHILCYETQEYNNLLLVYKVWFSELFYSVNFVPDSRITIVHKPCGKPSYISFELSHLLLDSEQFNNFTQRNIKCIVQ